MKNVKSIGILSTSYMHTRGLAAPQPCRLSASVKSDSIPLPDICTGFGSSGSNLIINLHCSGKSASQIGESIRNF